MSATCVSVAAAAVNYSMLTSILMRHGTCHLRAELYDHKTVEN